ncbi:MAG TPA: BlaI/MecI/CopY family transcriptional regulator [Saprospiraceae bacterium]|nr:BlaI/MecI/CopY family transcriptional regulator [Saprospiraceae bacterium]HPG09220.1 BlaI/MecI/CopY family transcriptional regulator [Saprospiraceae bacterium]HRV85953.1 BlaI/MecI/CopY family transcriptional regulator [Saprospiraceae bacterium]
MNVKVTDSELSILQVLWLHGPSTVREVHEIICLEREVGYTTTLKLMQIMLEKGLVSRDEAGKSHRYTASVKESAVQQSFIGKMLDTVFHGSPSALVLQALGSHETSPEELEKIKALIEQLEAQQRDQ